MQISKREIPFIQKQLYFVLLSIAITVLAIAMIAWKGLNFGIDFTGGVKIQYRLAKTIDIDSLRSQLSHTFNEPVLVQQLGATEEKRFSITLKSHEKGTEELKTLVSQALQTTFGNEIILEQEGSRDIGPKAGADLRSKGIKAIVITWLLILVYLGYRFDFFFSPGAIIALLHDLTVALGAFALTGREVNLTVLAAFLTLLGYSVNDTIIVYDRIRENTKKMPNLPLPTLVNQSINETLARTIVTSLVVFFVVLVLFLVGEGDIQDFGFTMLVGVVTGTYSSIFIASPIYIYLKKRFGAQKPVQKNNNVKKVAN